MTKAQLKVTNKCTSDLGTIVMHTVELLDADGVMKEYGIKDYHDNDGIIDTEIEDISTGEDVYIDSTLGKRIIDALEEYDKDVLSDEHDSMTYEDAHVNHDIVVPCSAELDNEMYNESI